MEISSIIQEYGDDFKTKYAAKLLPGHFKAINAMLRCRTPEAGEMILSCTNCGIISKIPRSCGHRSCPKCQNHETSQWLDRQKEKLLPVEYFMVTFTLPCELRNLAWCNQTKIYNIMFTTASKTLKDFGLNPKFLGANIGLTAILHTHSRRLDYHPHLHVIVPGGGVDQKKKQWKKKKGKYLFNVRSLSKVFRARFLDALNSEKLSIPYNMPKKWVVHCKNVGKGEPALKYLSRYLYRGVISEKNILESKNGEVTFRYTDSGTDKTEYRKLKGEDFIWLVLQHVLPRGFRRVRDYGFLHANAKKLLQKVQYILRVFIKIITPRSRPEIKCPHCKSPMQFLSDIIDDLQSG